MLYDPLILFSYLIYYILYVGYDVSIILYCVIGYDVWVNFTICYWCNSWPAGVVGFVGVAGYVIESE